MRILTFALSIYSQGQPIYRRISGYMYIGVNSASAILSSWTSALEENAMSALCDDEELASILTLECMANGKMSDEEFDLAKKLEESIFKDRVEPVNGYPEDYYTLVL